MAPWERDRPLAGVLASLARSAPQCTVYACSDAQHTLQIYAGLYALHAAGRIRLKQRFGEAALQERLGAGIDARLFCGDVNALFVDLEGAGLVCFDVRDGANFYQHVVDRVVLYAKRSFRRRAYQSSAGKFVPLGLNYAAFLDRTTLPDLVKALRQLEASPPGLKRLLIALGRLLPSGERWLNAPTLRTLCAPPEPRLEPRVLFLARTWAPERGLPGAHVKELNDFRAACIRALRARFGERFFGGFARTAHARERYPDCVVDPDVSTRRADYLQRVKAYPICVTTTGLWESIGWKFGEYVALSRAIVCEPLRFELPGSIAAGENFLEFSSTRDCTDAVAALFDDARFRRRMMESNWSYYREHGTPEAIVGRVLDAALRRNAKCSASCSY